MAYALARYFILAILSLIAKDANALAIITKYELSWWHGLSTVSWARYKSPFDKWLVLWISWVKVHNLNTSANSASLLCCQIQYLLWKICYLLANLSDIVLIPSIYILNCINFQISNPLIQAGICQDIGIAPCGYRKICIFHNINLDNFNSILIGVFYV